MEAKLLMTFIIIIAIIVGIFLLFRQFMLWYWRVNETVNLLNGIKNELANLNPSGKFVNKEREEITNLNPSVKPVDETRLDIICVHCGNEFSIEREFVDLGKFFCPKCHKINYYKAPSEIPGEMDAICTNCSETIELNSREIRQKKFICPNCNKLNNIN